MKKLCCLFLFFTLLYWIFQMRKIYLFCFYYFILLPDTSSSSSSSSSSSYYYYYYYYYYSFSHQRKLMVFHWSLSDSKSPQVSRTLLSILTVFTNAVVWMVSTLLPTSKSFRPFGNPLVTVPKAPIKIGVFVTFIFHFFFQFSGKVEVLISLFIFFQFYSVVSRDNKVENFGDFFFFFWLL